VNNQQIILQVQWWNNNWFWTKDNENDENRLRLYQHILLSLMKLIELIAVIILILIKFWKTPCI